MFDILLCLVVTLFIKYFYSRSRLYQLASEFPGPTALPLVGNWDYAMPSKEDNSTFKTLHTLYKQYGAVFRLWHFQQLHIYIKDPAAIKIIWEKNLIYERRPNLKNMLSPLVGDGILTTNDFNKWKKNKRIILPNFRSKVVFGYTETFEKNSSKLVDKLTNLDQAVQIINLLRDCITYSVFETTTGAELDADLLEDINKNYLVFFDICKQRQQSFWLYNEKTLNMTKVAEELRRCVHFLRNVLSEFVDKKLKEGDSKGESACTIELLIRSSLTGKVQLLDEVVTLFHTGIETTPLATSFLLAVLGEHQDVQEQVYQEQKSIFADDITRSVTAEDINKMLYLDKVIQEVLRLYPIVPIMGTIVKEEVPLDKGLIIPKDSYILVSVFSLHRDPDLYPEPDKFNPERFTPEENLSRNPYSYMPFGRGRTTCPGRIYALTSLKTLVSILVRRLRVAETVGGMESIEQRLYIGGILRLAGGITLRFEPRED